MRTIAIINQKGGVGKTTVAANLAHGLALLGKRVTILDLDPQAQLSATLGVVGHEPGMDEVLLDGASLESKRRKVRENLYLVPANMRLAEIERIQDKKLSHGQRLKKALEGQLDDQDIVLFDCPPSSGLIVINALFATGEVLIPMLGEYLSLQGLSHLMGTIKNFEASLNHELKQWIVVNRFQRRRRLANDVLNKLMEYFPESVLATPIRDATALAESPGFGQTIFEYQPRSACANDFSILATDLVEERVMTKDSPYLSNQEEA